MTLQLYILRQVVTALVFTVTGMVVIAVPGMAIGAMQRLGGAFVGQILGYLPLEFIGLAPYLLPVGFLLSVVTTYGRLAADNEWTAMSAAGFSPLRLLLPGFVVALVLGGTTWLLTNEIAPPVSHIKRQYRSRAFVQGLRTLAPGRTQIHIGRFHLTSRFREGNEFRDAIVSIPGEDGEPDQQILADRLSYQIDEESLTVRFQGARAIGSHQDAEFLGTITLRKRLDALTGEDDSQTVRWHDLSSPDLRAALARGEVKAKDVAAAHYELHARHALAATCLMFLLLGAPTGLLLRRGTQLGALAAAVGYALAYLVLTLRFGRTLAESGTVPAWLGAWSSTILGGVAGLWLTWKGTRS